MNCDAGEVALTQQPIQFRRSTDTLHKDDDLVEL